MSIYDKIVDQLHDSVSKRPEAAGSGPQNVVKGKRPLKMPKNYDFSVRHVKWADYSKDFILRTDAVWEKAKLFDTFYTQYKSNFTYAAVDNKYMIADIRIMPLPTNEAEHIEDWRTFMGYTDIDGCVWQFRFGPSMQRPTSMTSHPS